MASSSAATAELNDLVLCGRHVALLPYSPRHVPVRFKWQCEPGNRLDEELVSATEAEEQERQQALASDENHVCFMVADAERLSSGLGSETEALLGEVHIIMGSGHTSGLIEMMLLEHSVRRKALICETLLLVLKYGIDILRLGSFAVHLRTGGKGANGQDDNRLIFAERVEAGPADVAAASPASQRRASIVGRIKEKRKSKKAGASGDQAEFLQGLTKHLLREDAGAHWPIELDFELTGPGIIELFVNDQTVDALNKQLKSLSLSKYSSLDERGILWLSTTTRVDGTNAVLLPYGADHVPTVHTMMQLTEGTQCFQVKAPTLAQEKRAQESMWNDGGCYAFVIGVKRSMQHEKWPVTIVGRAQLVFLDSSQASVRVYIPTSPPRKDHQALVKEAVTMLLKVALTMPLKRLLFKPDNIVVEKGIRVDSVWPTEVPIVVQDGVNQVRLDTSAAIAAAANASSGCTLRVFDPENIVYSAIEEAEDE